MGVGECVGVGCAPLVGLMVCAGDSYPFHPSLCHAHLRNSKPPDIEY